MRGDGHALKTIYFGGGTPSMLTIGELMRIKTAIEESFDLSQVEEVTIEANPEDVTSEWLKELTEMDFFNRISIGVQSFNDEDLRVINRRHNASQSVEAIRNATEAGFHNLSIDLIMGLPQLKSPDSQNDNDMSLVSWRNNLKTLDALLPLGSLKHISCYELTVEEDTILYRQLHPAEDILKSENPKMQKLVRVQLPDEDVVAEEYETLLRWCRQSGFQQYEVSNFALPGWHSRHNSRYWDRTPYLGVGAGAHSFDGKCRRWNLTDIQAYIDGVEKGVVPFGEELLTREDAFNEYMMTALRTTNGISKERLAMLFPEYVQPLASEMEKYKLQGLVIETPESYVPTAKGLLQADAIAAELFKKH